MNVRQITSINEVSAASWNALIDDGYPFLRHEFLSALETSGCVSAKTGWFPSHLLLFDHNRLLAALPMYLKTHSQGEYVFDNQWAYAAGHYRQQYYPKCLTSVPFTPCQGKRLLIKPGVDNAKVSRLLFEFIQQSAREKGYSSWHCLFPEKSQLNDLLQLGMLKREGIQFHWFNQNYTSFDAFLAELNARKRKMIKRERQRVTEQGIDLIQLPGDEVMADQWRVFFNFYQMTYFKNGMPPYLNLAFFEDCAKTMGKEMLLVLALKSGHYIGAALSFIGRDTLYGRYWGCMEEYNALHFETCFYQGLDYCIANGLKQFDSGAQGEHKIARGFAPVTTYSAHWLKDPQFAAAVQRFLLREKASVRLYKLDAETLLPYKQLPSEK